MWSVCLTAVKNVRFSCWPLTPWLWPHVSLNTVWLHLIMTNSILLHPHNLDPTITEQKKLRGKSTHDTDKRWKTSRDLAAVTNWAPVIALYVVVGFGLLTYWDTLSADFISHRSRAFVSPWWLCACVYKQLQRTFRWPGGLLSLFIGWVSQQRKGQWQRVIYTQCTRMQR